MHSNQAHEAVVGLTHQEARQRLRDVGPNELPRTARRSAWRVLLGVLREPMFLLLALAAAMYLAVGGLGEGLLMAAFAGLSIALVVAQETRSENALEALRALATPMARVLREGRELRIAAREVVPGDILLVTDGERVAADAVLHRAENVSADESLLTGESVPVPKRAATALQVSERPHEQNTVYANTLVTSGRGLAEVFATGTRTEAGRIGVSLAEIELEPTLLQRSFARLIRVFATFAVVASAAVVLLYGLVHGDWFQGVLSGIALGMAALPEEFPMVLVVFVALGAWRLARSRVLVRRTAVIEVLGACSTLCVDKTGTLTENRMRVCAVATTAQEQDVQGDEASLPSDLAAVVRVAAAASATTSNDPMDLAVHRLALGIHAAPARSAVLLREYGLTENRPAVVRVWEQASGTIDAAAKGAPETIGLVCRTSSQEHHALLQRVHAYAARGMRVLAVAHAANIARRLPEDPHDLGLALIGLIAFADPLRAGARDAVDAARRAGVSVAMITGDHPTTAMAIAAQAGIDCTAPPLTGADIEALDADGLRRAVARTRVFARVRPEQKLRLVRAFKDNGEVVAMTGDGVNDAPALKAAHIGLAMGGRGTDVAREAAAIVLLEDDLRHLVDGIETGRRIFDNLRKAAIYIAAVHIPICGLALLPLLLGMPPLLLPMHVVLIEMVIDPVCAIAFENEPVEARTMERPPRRPDELLLGWPQLAVALVQGSLLLAASLGVYAISLRAGFSADAARTAAFLCFTAGNLALIRVVATRGATLKNLLAPEHGAYWLVAATATAVTIACMSIPVLQHLFRFEAPSPAAIGTALAIGIASALVFDLAKLSARVQRVLGTPGSN